jgi:hypothetical protein
MFIIFVIGDKSDILLSFINLTEILSTPVTFLTLNLSMTLDTIILQNKHKIVTKNVDVAEVFNKVFVNVVQDIGKDYAFNKNDHPSLQKFEDKNFVKNSLNSNFLFSLFTKFLLNLFCSQFFELLSYKNLE